MRGRPMARPPRRAPGRAVSRRRSYRRPRSTSATSGAGSPAARTSPRQTPGRPASRSTPARRGPRSRSRPRPCRWLRGASGKLTVTASVPGSSAAGDARHRVSQPFHERPCERVCDHPAVGHGFRRHPGLRARLADLGRLSLHGGRSGCGDDFAVPGQRGQCPGDGDVRRPLGRGVFPFGGCRRRGPAATLNPQATLIEAAGFTPYSTTTATASASSTVTVTGGTCGGRCPRSRSPARSATGT